MAFCLALMGRFTTWSKSARQCHLVKMMQIGWWRRWSTFWQGALRCKLVGMRNVGEQALGAHAARVRAWARHTLPGRYARHHPHASRVRSQAIHTGLS